MRVGIKPNKRATTYKKTGMIAYDNCDGVHSLRPDGLSHHHTVSSCLYDWLTAGTVFKAIAFPCACPPTSFSL